MRDELTITSCKDSIFVKESNKVINGDASKPEQNCDMGPNKKGCPSDPWTINGGDRITIDMFKSDSTSVKFSRDNDWQNPKVTQFEYTQNDKFWFDISDIDGKGKGITGSPFFDENVMAWTDGDRTGSNTCIPIKCEKNKICQDAYQFPDDKKTHVSLSPWPPSTSH